jgi:competence protein ComEA
MGLDKGDRSGRLNINAASLADLDALPGIGQALAQRIVERRQRLGPFQSVEQLREERLIPSATFERIKDLVSVS